MTYFGFFLLIGCVFICVFIVQLFIVILRFRLSWHLSFLERMTNLSISYYHIIILYYVVVETPQN